MADNVRYLAPVDVDNKNRKKYCRFKKGWYKVHRLQRSGFLDAFCKRTRKDFTKKINRNFFEVSTKSFTSN